MSEGNQVSVGNMECDYSGNQYALLGRTPMASGSNQIYNNTEPPLVMDDPQASQNRVRLVQVSPCLNGYTVHVGCQTVVFRHGQEEELGRELARYLVDPSGVEAGYRKAATEGAVLRRGVA